MHFLFRFDVDVDAIEGEGWDWRMGGAVLVEGLGWRWEGIGGMVRYQQVRVPVILDLLSCGCLSRQSGLQVRLEREMI